MKEPLLTVFMLLDFFVCLTFKQTQVHLELFIEHVHSRGLREQRSSAAVLFQAGQGRPVERRVRGARSEKDKSGLK